MQTNPASTSEDSHPAGAPARWAGEQIVAAILVAALFVAARIWWATISTLDQDEAFSLVAVRHSWADLLHAITGDLVHPPLFYVALKLWLGAFGEELFSLRLLPILLSAASIGPMYRLSRELGVPSVTANLGVFLVAVNPFLVRYSQELRMYSLLLLLGLMSLCVFVRYAREAAGSAGLIPLACVNMLMVYTHYLGWVLVALEGAFLLWRRRSKLPAFTVWMSLVGVAFLIWAGVVLSHAITQGGVGAGLQKHLGWNPRPDWRDLVAFLAQLNGPFRRGLSFSKAKLVIGFALFEIPIALALWKRVRAGDRVADDRSANLGPVAWFGFFAFAPVVATYGLSWFLPVSIFQPRYLILAAVPYLILCALSLMELQPVPIRAAAAVLAMVWASIGFAEEARLEDRVDWVRLVEDMRKAERTPAPAPAERVPFFVYTHPEPIRYTLERDGEERFSVKPGRLYFLERGSDHRPTMRTGKFDELRGPRFWLAYQESFWYPDTTRSLRRHLADAGYQMRQDFQSGLDGHQGHIALFENPSEAPGSPPEPPH
jgi:hypothetical protein